MSRLKKIHFTSRKFSTFRKKKKKEKKRKPIQSNHSISLISMAFVCDVCGKSFLTSQKLRFHRVVHGEDMMKCHICDKICTGKKTFNNHIKTHQTYECEVCKETIKMNSMSNHNKKCGSKEGKRFGCKECPYEVDREDRLRIHIENKHSTASKPKFECTFCKKELNSADKLKVHEKKHASSTLKEQGMSLLEISSLEKVHQECGPLLCHHLD